MSRGRSSKRGVFTQTQFSALRETALRCRRVLMDTRLRNITMQKDECLPIFVKEKHHDLLLQAGKLCTTRDLQYLAVDVTGRYANSLAEPLTYDMRFVVRVSNLDFAVPDYADGRRNQKRGEPKELPAHLQKYVDARLSLAVEFGLLDCMINWFADANVSFPEMIYLFPAIIPLLSQHEATKKLAEKHDKPSVPSYVPSLPGRREAFSLVETAVMKTLLLLNEGNTIRKEPPILLDTRFVDEHMTYMGWGIRLN